MADVLDQGNPHSADVCYAGFPVSGNGGIGLWCPVCGLTLEAVIHEKDRVSGLHRMHRKSRLSIDTWYCAIQ